MLVHYPKKNKKKTLPPTADKHPRSPEAKGSAVSHFQVLMFHHIEKQFDPKRQSEKQQKKRNVN